MASSKPPAESDALQPPQTPPTQQPPQLVFDGSSFESANIASAKLVSVNPVEYDLHIRPDTLNTRHRVWFYFSVRGASAGQKVLFNICGYSKTKSLFRDGMAPVVSSSGRPYWERMPPQSIYYYRSPRHNREYVLSFPFCFDRADETYYFAYCFPYTFGYLQRFLFALEGRNLPHMRREVLGRSIQERRVDLLTISSPSNLELDAAICAGEPAEGVSPSQRRHVVLLTARIHPGESPSSFVMHGLLLFLASDHPRARELREVAILKVRAAVRACDAATQPSSAGSAHAPPLTATGAHGVPLPKTHTPIAQVVPMLNPDGVFAGNYRCNSIGLDLNRMWHASSQATAPTIHAVRQLAQTYTQHPIAALGMIVDMHAHSTCMNGFMFANLPDDPRDTEAVAAFPHALGNHAAAFQGGCKFDHDPTKEGTGRRALSQMLPGVHCYTLEVSMFCAAQGHARGDAYVPSSYTEMGQAIGLALHEHFCTSRGAGALQSAGPMTVAAGGAMAAGGGMRAGVSRPSRQCPCRGGSATSSPAKASGGAPSSASPICAASAGSSTVSGTAGGVSRVSHAADAGCAVGRATTLCGSSCGLRSQGSSAPTLPESARTSATAARSAVEPCVYLRQQRTCKGRAAAMTAAAAFQQQQQQQQQQRGMAAESPATHAWRAARSDGTVATTPPSTLLSTSPHAAAMLQRVRARSQAYTTRG